MNWKGLDQGEDRAPALWHLLRLINAFARKRMDRQRVGIVLSSSTTGHGWHEFTLYNFIHKQCTQRQIAGFPLEYIPLPINSVAAAW